MNIGNIALRKHLRGTPCVTSRSALYRRLSGELDDCSFDIYDEGTRAEVMRKAIPKRGASFQFGEKIEN